MGGVGRVRGNDRLHRVGIRPERWRGGADLRRETAGRLSCVTLAFRVGGRRVWGSFPFFESAFIGGAASLPGYHSNRFAGDASLYSGVQLRFTLGRTFLALPARWGVFGNASAGRVYVDGESPGGWHGAGGGGVWLSLLNHENTVSLAVDSESEGTLLQSGVAFGF